MNETTEKKIAIFIPTYNAARTIVTVLERIPEKIKKKVKEIFILDNNSPDNTYLVGIGYKHEKEMPNLEIYKNEINKGYGGSQKIAYQYAIDRGFDIIVMLHGDAQYAPEKIPAILEPLEKDEADISFGSRISGLPLAGGMPLHRFLGNKFLTAVENLVLNWNLSEYHSGFRAFNCKALRQIPFHLCSDDYHFDTEILIQYKLKGLRVIEIPIPTYYGNERSYVKIWKYGFSILATLLEYILHKKNIKKYPKFNIN